MREVSVQEARTHFSALLDAVETHGEMVVITRHGRPVAKLSPASGVNQSPAPRLASAAELTERFRVPRQRVAAANPNTENLTWDELKRLARDEP
jgi:prevent-host-death family protein